MSLLVLLFYLTLLDPPDPPDPAAVVYHDQPTMTEATAKSAVVVAVVVFSWCLV
jgi:hypothetical protein